MTNRTSGSRVIFLPLICLLLLFAGMASAVEITDADQKNIDQLVGSVSIVKSYGTFARMVKFTQAWEVPADEADNLYRFRTLEPGVVKTKPGDQSYDDFARQFRKFSSQKSFAAGDEQIVVVLPAGISDTTYLTSIFAPWLEFGKVGSSTKWLFPRKPSGGVYAKGKQTYAHTAVYGPKDAQDFLSPGDAKAVTLRDDGSFTLKLLSGWVIPGSKEAPGVLRYFVDGNEAAAGTEIQGKHAVRVELEFPLPANW